MIFFNGILYEKLKKFDKANEIYNLADLRYEELIFQNPDSVELIFEKLLFTAYTVGKKDAIS